MDTDQAEDGAQESLDPTLKDETSVTFFFLTLTPNSFLNHDFWFFLTLTLTLPNPNPKPNPNTTPNPDPNRNHNPYH